MNDMGYLCEDCYAWMATYDEAERHSDEFGHSLGPCPQENAPPQGYDPDDARDALRRAGMTVQVARNAETFIALAAARLTQLGEVNHANRLTHVLGCLARAEHMEQRRA